MINTLYFNGNSGIIFLLYKIDLKSFVLYDKDTIFMVI